MLQAADWRCDTLRPSRGESASGEGATMNVRQLETLVWVAALKSFQAAALRLHITQPAVSARIAALESELGEPLFDRSASHPTLTARGEQVARYAQEVIKLTRTLKEGAAGTPGIGQSIVRIGAVPTLTHAWLPHLVRLVQERFPSVQIEVVVERSDQLRKRLSQRELDVAFLFGPSFDTDVRSVWLGDAAIVWVAAPALGLAGQQLGAGDLASHVVITYESGSHVSFELQRHLASKDVTPRAFIHTNSTTALLRLVRSGAGIAAVSSVAVEPDCEHEALDVLEVDIQLPKFEIFASYLASAPSPIGGDLVVIASEISERYHRQRERSSSTKRAAAPKPSHATGGVPIKRSASRKRARTGT
jgi:DNA-binding transcriptional LysR family regulator